ncbi:PREDICTED: dermokine isoform X8 [Cercocebus atys]|uniref:dermokine isoform X8 n=1 Tax=Cercocebus atys TaxID=9531 RepID=UPI0005F58485|nr:PREDICTED: dermokine isoform X8 [Cercocebus atys]
MNMKLATASALLLLLLGLAWTQGSHGWGADMSSLQKRAGGADQNYNYNQHAYPTAYGGQYSVKTPAKGGVSPSSSASRVQPGLLQWVKFW